MRFKTPEGKQIFLGRLYEKRPDAVELIPKSQKVYEVTLEKEEITLTAVQFKKHWKAIRTTAELFDMRVVVADFFPNYWNLTEVGKKLKPKEIKKLFSEDEWASIQTLLK